MGQSAVIVCENELWSHIIADFQEVEFSEWNRNPLFTRENVAFNLNRMLRATDLLLKKFCALVTFYWVHINL